MKKIYGFLVLLAGLSACTPGDGKSYEKFTAFVDISSTIIPDSALLGQTVPVYVLASAQSGCWSDLNIQLGPTVISDTTFSISATGVYESYNGICAEVVVTHDTTFQFRPDSAGTYIFIAYSARLIPGYDTLVVMDTARRSGRFRQ